MIDNVMIALAIRGYSKRIKKQLAKRALVEVGLESHIYSDVRTLSGGEKQRVAMARALVSEPSVVLCDEPTGALDSKTSIEVMDILKDISKTRLVIIVTHNEELASKYSSRIIRIKDGKIEKDTRPYSYNREVKKSKKIEGKRMPYKTCLSLSLHNLLSKKKRTLLTSIAASIGIIGISLILGLSNGVKEYISKEEKNTFSYYPIEISKEEINYNNIEVSNTSDIPCKKETICSKDDISNSNEIIDTLALKKNNLVKFKQYLDNSNEIKKYVYSINYKYNLVLNIYSTNHNKVNPVNNTFTSGIIDNGDNNIFKEIDISNKYELITGKYPDKYNEIVLVVDKDNKINMSLLYNLNIEDINELNNKIKSSKKEISIDNKSYSYGDLINREYKLVLNTSYYEKKNNVWAKITNMNEVIDNSLTLKIVGIIKDNSNKSYVGYTRNLTNYVVEKNVDSDIYKEQINNKNIDVLTNKEFVDITYEERINSLGVIGYDKPIAIEIYPKSFESKDKIEKVIDKYNSKQKDKDKISYTDLLGILLETITSIVSIISYILIALVAISLIVSSIMIAIITHISVLERTKEIGILRSMGASKKDITRIFLSEKLIDGILASIIGICIARLLIIPTNIVIERITKINNLAYMNYKSTFYLLIISIVITIVSGLRPAKKAAKIQIVEALRNQ